MSNVIVVTTEKHLTLAEKTKLEEDIQTKFPENIVLVLPRGVSINILRNEDGLIG